MEEDGLGSSYQDQGSNDFEERGRVSHRDRMIHLFIDPEGV